MMEDELSQEMESQQILEIATSYFLREAGGDQAKANELLAKLATTVQEPGVKLVHLNRILFLIIVRGQGVVEVHTMAADIVPSDMVEGFQKLAKYLENIGVKIAYTYSDDRRFARIARQTKLPIRELTKNIDGKETYIYIVEF
jgi:hypothetical protein